MVKSKHADDRARRQHLIVRRLSGELDDRAFQGTDQGERDSPGRRAGWGRPHPAPRVDEAAAGA